MRGLHAGRDPSAVPVHGELGDQGDIRVVRSRLVLIVQEVQVGPVDGETLPPELVTQVVLVQLGELLLQLKHRRGGLGTEGRPGGAQGPAPRALSLSPLDAAGGQTQKGSLAVFIFLCSFQSNFKKVTTKGSSGTISQAASVYRSSSPPSRQASPWTCDFQCRLLKGRGLPARRVSLTWTCDWLWLMEWRGSCRYPNLSARSQEGGHVCCPSPQCRDEMPRLATRGARDAQSTAQSPCCPRQGNQPSQDQQSCLDKHH